MNVYSKAAGGGVERGLVISLLSGAIDWGAYVHHLLARLAERLGADAAALYLRGLPGGGAALEAAHQIPGARAGSPLAKDPAGDAMENPGGLLVADRGEGEPGPAFCGEFGELPLPSMMAVWLGEAGASIGALALFREGVGSFTERDLAQAGPAARQLEVMLDFGAVVSSFAKHPARPPGPGGAAGRSFHGKTVAPGRCAGRLSIHRYESAADILRHERMANRSDAADPLLFGRALERARAELASDREELRRLIPEADTLLFDAHEMMLGDEVFTSKIEASIADGMGVARAIGEAAAEFIHILESSAHEHLREKARDVEDLALRLLDNLAETRPAGFQHGRIIVARELRPSEVVRVARASVGGVVLCSGGATAHIALLVRSLGIPTLIARTGDVMRLDDGLPALLDATEGVLVVNPSGDDQTLFLAHAPEPAAAPAPLPAGGVFTADGARVTTLANVNLLSELQPVLDLRADGVGLYRTEIAYLVRDSLPGENELTGLYQNFFALARGLPVTVRTLDAGSDKFIDYLHSGREDNPALGLRSIRLTLRHPEIFCSQLRALLRAAAGRENVRLMFPMVSSLDELRAARALYEKCRAEIEDETGLPCGVQTGMMVELPAAAELAPAFAAEAGFFSIGTNDFIQYMLAVDRANVNVMEHFTPHAPAVLRALKRVASAAADAGIECSVCGEMGHDPRFIPFFLGIGVRALSVEVPSLPTVHRVVSSLTLSHAREYADALLAADSIAGAQALLRNF